MKIIRDARLCDNCFKVDHFASGCMLKNGCYIEGPLNVRYLQGKKLSKFVR